MITLETQKKRITKWAADNGYYIVDWLEDKLSGRDYIKRKIDRAIDQVANGQVVGVAVYRLDRWGRNAQQSMANEHRTRLAGGMVFSATESNDVETPDGIYNRQNAYSLAERQSNIIRENWKDAKQERLDNKLPTGGLPRFGYSYEPRNRGGEGVYSPDPVTHPLLRECYLRYTEGTSFDDLCLMLNKAGATTSHGHAWEARSLQRMLDSGFGAGFIVRMSDADRKANIPLEDREFRPGKHEPAINRDEWNAYVSRRIEMRDRHPRLRQADYRLSGIVTCARCGGPMTHGRNTYYRGGAALLCPAGNKRIGTCSKPGRVHVADVEDEVRKCLVELLAEADPLVERYKSQQQARTARLGTEGELLRAELADLQKRLDKLTDGWEREVLDDETYRARKRPVAARIGEVKAELANVERLESMSASAAVMEIRTATEGWDGTPIAAQNEGLRKLIADVLVDGPRVIVVGRWEVRP